eukprot:218027-Pleurochrysis_carterae.AAC.3
MFASPRLSDSTSARFRLDVSPDLVKTRASRPLRQGRAISLTEFRQMQQVSSDVHRLRQMSANFVRRLTCRSQKRSRSRISSAVHAMCAFKPETFVEAS